MAVAEKIGGTELSTYGLRLSKPALSGHLDLPKFKNIIKHHDWEANLRVLDEQNVKIKLIGFYADKAAMGTALSNFYTKVQSSVKQLWEFSNYGFSETCVVKDEINTTPYQSVAVEVELTLTITSA
nr:hypothetical protein [uncultured Draconibacterium sp.]